MGPLLASREALDSSPGCRPIKNGGADAWDQAADMAAKGLGRALPDNERCLDTAKPWGLGVEAGIPGVAAAVTPAAAAPAAAGPAAAVQLCGGGADMPLPCAGCKDCSAAACPAVATLLPVNVLWLDAAAAATAALRSVGRFPCCATL